MILSQVLTVVFHNEMNCDVTVTLKSSTSSVKKTNDAMATGGMYK